MESKSDSKMKFETWLHNACPQGISQILPMPGDASMRQYYRLLTPAGSFVAMDAPPPENCLPFVAVAKAIRAHDLHAPEIHAADIDHGFLLLSDMGEKTFLSALTVQPEIEYADVLYRRALSALAVLQAIRSVPGHVLQPFGRQWMEKEWLWHQEWTLNKWLDISQVPAGVHDCYEQLIISALEQPQVFMHRDFHSANLMVMPTQEVGILDFQDAFIGPVTYDPASLLRDCYIEWPAAKVTEWARFYANLIHLPEEQFIRWFDFMSLQRHIKALMTFARKAVRDNTPRYLAHVPRTLNYIVSVSSAYPEMNALHQFYNETVRSAVQQKVPELCAQ
jgi:N-acetylmuramate 1-kinase